MTIYTCVNRHLCEVANSLLHLDLSRNQIVAGVCEAAWNFC